MTDLEHIFQTGSFIEYAKKFGVNDMNDLMDLFEGWAAGKDFIESDKNLIFKLVQEYYLLKAKEKELKEKRKSSKHKKEIPKSIDDIRQLKFDF